VTNKCLLATLVAGPLLMACGEESPTGPSEVLTGTVWTLQSFQTTDEGTIAVPEPDHYTAEFAEDGGLNVGADCNTCRGSYSATATMLTINPALACTEVYCGDDSLDFRYLQALGTVSAYAVSEDELRLTYTGGVLSFSGRQ
jgi:heat shock protein HslJ